MQLRRFPIPEILTTAALMALLLMAGGCASGEYDPATGAVRWQSFDKDIAVDADFDDTGRIRKLKVNSNVNAQIIGEATGAAVGAVVKGLKP